MHSGIFIFRLFWNSPRAVEVYPGDGSVMRSKGLSGHYFEHCIYHEDQVSCSNSTHSLVGDMAADV